MTSEFEFFLFVELKSELDPFIAACLTLLIVETLSKH
jgi:hypothetical protein